MGLEEVEAAVAKSKVKTAENNPIEVIARILDVDAQTVERVLYLGRVVTRYRDAFDDDDGFRRIPSRVMNMMDEMFEGLSIDGDVKKAMDHAIGVGLSRVTLKHLILNGGYTYVAASRLVKSPAEICNGCPQAIPCVAENLSSPKKCYDEVPLSITPLELVGKNMNKVVVRSERAEGTCTIDVTALVEDL